MPNDTDESILISAVNPTINAVVTASAGTGKTYLLITRIIRILLEGAKPDSILAITFTRKAAGEMRERLSERLAELALCEDFALEQKLISIGLANTSKYTAKARQLYEELLFHPQKIRIITFHAFCQELLTRFSVEADVSTGFELLENTGIYEKLAWERLLLETTTNPESDISQALKILLKNCNGIHNTQAALIDGFLANRSDWWAFTEGEENTLGYATQSLKNFFPYTENPLNNFFSKNTIEKLQKFNTLLKLHSTTKNQQYSQHIEYVLNNHSINIIESFQATKKAFLTSKLKPFERKASQTLEKKLGIVQLNEYLNLHNILSSLIVETHEKYLNYHNYNIHIAWYKVGNILLNNYQNIKLEKNLLDFSDLEWKTYQLLHTRYHASWIQYKLDQKIDHILIDEFQDTNPIQWKLVIPLLEEISSYKPEYPRSIFIVGDPKQSIYSFRRANPKLQKTASAWLEKRQNTKLLSLSKSWRSAPLIMEYINTVFERTIFADHILGFNTHKTHQESYWGRIEILPLIPLPNKAEKAQNALRNPLTTPRSEEFISPYYIEGQKIAEHIKTLLQRNYAIKKDNKLISLSYKDIMVLVRNRSHTIDYEKAFNEADIPFLGVQKGLLLESLEVKDIEALLQILITPFDNMRFLQILRSPLFSISDNDILLLTETQNSAYWYERLTYLANNSKISKALLSVHEKLKKWRSWREKLPIHDILERIYHDGKIIQRYKNASHIHKKDRVIANLQRLLEIALEVDGGRYPSIIRFLEKLKNIRLTQPSEHPDEPTSADSENKVRLMTIHAAKGLEAPIVYLADTNNCSSLNESYKALIDWSSDTAQAEYMLLHTTTDKITTEMHGIHEKKSKANKTEETNILYVALSRAQHMLVVSGSENARPEKGTWYHQLDSAIIQHPVEISDNAKILSSNKIPVIEKVVPNRPSLSEKGSNRFQITTTISNITKSNDISVAEQDSMARDRGIIVHNFLERITDPHAHTFIDISKHCSFSIQNTLLEEWLVEAKNLVTNPDLGFLFNPAQYEAAYKELPILYFDSQEKPLYGVIDRLVLNKDTVWIIDYKTQEIIPNNNYQAIANNYKIQLGQYMEGVKKIWPDKTIKAAILFTYSSRLVEIQYS